MTCPSSLHSSFAHTSPTALSGAISDITADLEKVGMERSVLEEKRDETAALEIFETVDEERCVLKEKRSELDIENGATSSVSDHIHQFPPTPPPSVPLTPKSSIPASAPSPLLVPFYNISDSNNFLQTSPYSEQDHLLDLRTVSAPCRLLACALTIMATTTPDYSTAPYKLAFNWGNIVAKLRHLSHQDGPEYIFPESSFYAIVFRSRVQPNVNYPRLIELDKTAHREASEAGNLLKYWYGEPNAEGRNLATCIWRDISDAKKGGRGPGHRLAMQEVIGHYLEWHVERLKLVISEGAESWNIVDW